MLVSSNNSSSKILLQSPPELGDLGGARQRIQQHLTAFVADKAKLAVITASSNLITEVGL